MQLQCTIQEGHVWLGNRDATVEVVLTTLAGAPGGVVLTRPAIIRPRGNSSSPPAAVSSDAPPPRVCLRLAPYKRRQADRFSKVIMSFASLGLSDALVRAVTEHGYTAPTPIQLQAIPAVLAGGDLLAGAQTGTGKTAGFVLPMLQRLAPTHAAPRTPPRQRQEADPAR